MARLPISRVVDVTLTRQDRFATTRGFGVALILTTDASGPLDASTRTRVYGSMQEVEADWGATTEPYKAALAVFSQNPSPRQLKIGYVDAGVLDDPASPTITEELDALYAADPDWYWLTTTREFRDTAILDDIFAWTDARPLLCIVDSNDALMEDPTDTTNVAARNKMTRERAGVFYHTDATVYPAAALIGYCARRNIDEANSAYTAKFKRLVGIPTINRGSAAVQAVTGFVPALGLDQAQGHLANTYVDIGGLPMVVEGQMLNKAFIDEMHASDWIIARTEEAMLSILANNDRVPYTNTGIQILIGGVEQVLGRASIAGLIADTEDPDTGELLPAYEIRVERVEDIPASQRRTRVAPVIEACFRYAGAIHYTSVRFTMQF